VATWLLVAVVDIAQAQVVPHVREAKDQGHDLYPENLEVSEVLVDSFTVKAVNATGVEWIRLHFDRFAIGARDYVRFTSNSVPPQSYRVEGRRIGAPRFVIGEGYAPYFSLFLNGNAVSIELYAASGSLGGDGIHLDFAHLGQEGGDVPWTCDGLTCETSAEFRVGRILVLEEDPEVGGYERYVAATGTMFQHSGCVLSAGRAFVDEVAVMGGDDFPPQAYFWKRGSVVMEVGAVIPNSTGSGQIQHPAPRWQYKLEPGSECWAMGLDGASVDAATDHCVFQIEPNEHSDALPTRWYFDLVKPQSDEVLDLYGYPTRVNGVNLVQYHTQTTFDATPPPPNGGGKALHHGDCLGPGSEGGPLSNGDELFGMHLETKAPFGICASEGRTFWDDDLDFENAASCVSQVCGSPERYDDLTICCAYNRPAIVWRMAMTLPGASFAFDVHGDLLETLAVPVLRYDRRYEIDVELGQVDLAGVSCVGPVRLRQSPTRPSRGMVAQRDSAYLFPADEMIDTFLEVDIGGTTFHNEQPVRLTAAIQSLPGYGDPYMPPTGPVTLYDPSGNPAGSIRFDPLTMAKPRDRTLSSIRLQTGAYGMLDGGGTLESSHDATAWDTGVRRWRAPAEIEAMDLRGQQPAAGSFIIRESALLPSTGAVDFVVYDRIPGQFPAPSFFDVFFEIELPSQGRTLYNPQPMRLTGALRGLPPTGDTLAGTSPVMLFDKQTGQPVTPLTSAMLFGGAATPPAPFPSAGIDGYCATAQAIASFGGPPITLALQGRVVRSRGAPTELADGNDRIATELLSMILASSSMPSYTLRLSPTLHTLGSIQQIQREFQYPAHSLLDGFFELVTPIGVLHNTQPFRIQADLSSLPETESHQNNPTQPAVALLDAQGNPRGLLHQLSVQPGSFYDPSCPSLIACSATPVAVEHSWRSPASLYSAAPNPFSRRTRISFDLEAAGPARLAVYDVAGRLVVVLAEGTLAGQRHEVSWDGNDREGRPQRSGLYFLRLDAGGMRRTRALVLAR